MSIDSWVIINVIAPNNDLLMDELNVIYYYCSHMSWFGYLELLITRHILSSPLKFDVTRVDCIYVADVTGGVKLLNFYWSGIVKYFLLLIAYNLFTDEATTMNCSFTNSLTATNDYDLYL